MTKAPPRATRWRMPETGISVARYIRNRLSPARLQPAKQRFRLPSDFR
jgi:hypothetical protein